MDIVVVGAGVTGVACVHALLKRGHKVTLVEEASSPGQGCSFGMAGFMGALATPMLCSPFKGKAGLASVFAKTRRLGWDVSLGHMKFLRQLANARSADKWKMDSESLVELARYSVATTEYIARLEDISYEQQYGLLRVFTNEESWEQAHKDGNMQKGGSWLSTEETQRLDPSMENVPNLLGSYLLPHELSGNGAYFSKQLQIIVSQDHNLTLMYHTKVKSLIKDEQGNVVGVDTEKGEVRGDKVILACNLGVQQLLAGVLELPMQVLTGWTLTLNTEPMNLVPQHSLMFENKDVTVTRLGNRIRVCGRYWLGSLSNDLADKTVEELYQGACKLLPMSAVWSDSQNWMGQTLIHPDSLPSCGATSIPGLYLNICHGVNGWALSSGCAQILADLIDEKTPVVNPEPYSPNRFAKN